MPQAASPPTSTVSQKVIAAGVIVGFLYVAGSLVMTVVIAALLAFTLDPAVRFLTRLRVPRSLAALVMVILLLVTAYLLFYFFYAQGQNFMTEFPKYSETLRHHVLQVRQRAVEIQKQTRQVIAPRETEGPEPPPPAEEQDSSLPLTAFLGAGLRSITEVLVLVSFIPFLVYFFLTWKSHLRRNAIAIVSGENRIAAERTFDGMTQMIYGFVVGNVIIGVLLSVASGIIFWGLHLPYPVFLGPMSGFLSLVPYFGVVLAMLPPLVAGLAQFTTMGPLIAVLVSVVALHLIAMNVLYPHIVGRRVHLNPVVVTLAIMFWGWLWGGMGLILAVPITSALKAVCDNVITLRAYGRLLGD